MLDTFWLILNYTCNNQCVVCYAESKTFQYDQMPIRYLREVIETMNSMKVKKCVFIGGEPTLYQYLPEVIRYAGNLGIKTKLITNGRKLKSKDYLSKLLDSGINKIVISIEGSNPQTHNSITRTESFNDTIEAIKNCVRTDCQVCSLTTIQLLNYDDCKSVPQTLKDIGIKEVVFNCGSPSIDRNCVVHSRYILPLDKIAKAIENIYLTVKSIGIKVRITANVPACLISQDILKEMLERKMIYFGCQMYYGRGVAFDPLGNILPCTHFAEFPLFKNAINEDKSFILKDSFAGIWEEEYNIPGLFRKKLWRYPVSICQGCRYWSHCLGGCPLFWSKDNPEDYITHSLS